MYEVIKTLFLERDKGLCGILAIFYGIAVEKGRKNREGLITFNKGPQPESNWECYCYMVGILNQSTTGMPPNGHF